MKHLTILLLTLLVLGGCATPLVYKDAEKRLFLEELEKGNWTWEEGKTLKTGIYPSGPLDRYYGVKIFKENHEVHIRTDGRVHFYSGGGGSEWLWLLAARQSGYKDDLMRYKHKIYAPYELLSVFEELCTRYFAEELKSIDFNEGDYNKEKMQIIYPPIIKAKCISKQKLAEAKYKEDVEKCKNYGFKEQTDGMSMCFMELKNLQIAEMERKLAQFEKNSKAEQEEREKARLISSRLLLGIGSALLNPNVQTNENKEISDKAFISYEDTYSSVLTVPSNQVCPILSTPITKQEIKHPNRICYYQ